MRIHCNIEPMSRWGTPSIFLQLVFASRLAPLAGFSVVFAATLMTGCRTSSIGEPRAFEVCTPDCAGKECGGDGCGGTLASCGTCALPEVCQANFTCAVPNTALFFQDKIQAGSKPWGFSATECEHPIQIGVACSDANGANISRVADPLGGGGFALRHYARVGDTGGPEGGARSQVGIWFNDNPEWQAAATSGNKIYIAQELYIPTEMAGTGLAVA